MPLEVLDCHLQYGMAAMRHAKHATNTRSRHDKPGPILVRRSFRKDWQLGSSARAGSGPMTSPSPAQHKRKWTMGMIIDSQQFLPDRFDATHLTCSMPLVLGQTCFYTINQFRN